MAMNGNKLNQPRTPKQKNNLMSNNQQSLFKFVTKSPILDQNLTENNDDIQCQKKISDIIECKSETSKNLSIRFIEDSNNEKENLPKPKLSKNNTLYENTKLKIKEDLKFFSPSKETEDNYENTLCHSHLNDIHSLNIPQEIDSFQNQKKYIIKNENFLHNRLQFLQDNFIKDAYGKTPLDPEYDPKTLFVPESFLKSQTPTMKQWWDLKSKYFNSVLFFKLGKFYELYHMDADIGVKELDLIYMRGDSAHAGFPEVSFPRYADILISKGYRVARVEQLETPQQMNERLKKKIGTNCIQRGICQVSSREVQTFSPVECTYEQNYAPIDDRKFLFMALVIKNLEISTKKALCFGLTAVDTTSSRIIMAQFTDDTLFSRLRTFLSIYNVKKVLVENSSLDSSLKSLFKSINCSIEMLRRSSEFPSSCHDAMQRFFLCSKMDASSVPNALLERFNDLSNSCCKVKQNSELVILSLGAITWYLEYHKISHEIFIMKDFVNYIPNDENPVQNNTISQKHMILDSIALESLDILKSKDLELNKNDRKDESLSLFTVIDFTQTPKGKEILKNWLICPLYKCEDIIQRQNIIKHLINFDNLDKIDLKPLPHFTRLLSVANCLAFKSSEHPDYRAVLFCESVINKRKAQVLLMLLNGFTSLLSKFEELRINSYLSQNCHLFKLLESFPCFKSEVEEIFSCFDVTQAIEKGVIIPNSGYFIEYDSSVDEVEKKISELNEYLEKQRSILNDDSISYSCGQSKFDLEISASADACMIPDDYVLVSQTKNVRRYTTEDLKNLKFNLERSSQMKSEHLHHSIKLIFTKFMENKEKWNKSIDLLGEIDALISLSKFSRGDRYPNNISMCLPELLEVDTNFIEIYNSFHPQMICNNKNVVPNDIVLNCHHFPNPLLILTGPNMGGKSTLMRQTAQLIILAQMGCFLPADKVKLGSVFDRIFVRIGANDSLIAGHSTFMTEMSQTSTILQHSTKKSLAIIDELGRGTSTFDGVSIAMAVAKELAQNIKCLTLFSTHYHELVFDLHNNVSNISFGHMDCMKLENTTDSQHKNQEIPEIVFLYKLVKGVCPKSYGFNAAKIAGVPDHIISNGIQKALELENCHNQLQKFWKIFSHANSIEDIRNLL